MNASTGTAQNLRSEGYQGEALAERRRIPLTPKSVVDRAIAEEWRT
jgi:hypothetical protein